MTIVLGPSQIVTLVADAGTPQDLAGFAGIRLIWPANLPLPTPGVRDVLEVTVGQTTYTIPGYLRTSNGQEWVMQAPVDPVIEALNAIPGADGWVSQSAKDSYASVGQAMRDHGLTLTDAKALLMQLYQGAVSNYVAAHP
jgi:hypothetical protein